MCCASSQAVSLKSLMSASLQPQDKGHVKMLGV
jgi:hypothetical protein